jgi:LSD1 subclass zinc finger protein
MALSADLLSILVCPACRGVLEYDPTASTLTCQACRLRYRVVDDIPVMLVDQAERLS